MPTGLTHLFIPGPTNVPDAVRRAINVPMEDHRAPDFPELTRGLFEDLKTVFANSTGRVFVYPSSGTGAWEAAITNTLRRGDRVLMAQVRPVLPPVGRHGAAARPRRRVPRRAVGRGRPARPVRRAPRR